MIPLRLGNVCGLAALVCLGCGGTGQVATPDGSADVRPDRPGADVAAGDAASPIDAASGLKVNGATLAVRDRLLGDETTYVHGFVTVERDGVLVADAVVVVNGVTLPLMIGSSGTPLAGLYDTKYVAVPPSPPGEAITLTVTQAGETTTLDLPCPANVTLTSPVDNAQVSSGKPLTVTWSGALDTGIFPAGSPMPVDSTYDIILPHLLFWDYEPATRDIGLARGSQIMLRDLRATSESVIVPAHPYLVLELFVRGRGARIPDGKTVGSCSLIRRVILEVKSE